MDGVIVIKTKMDTSGIDDGIEDIRAKIDTYVNELESGVEHTEEQQQAFRDLSNQLIEMKNTQQQIAEEQEQTTSNVYQWKNGVFELANGMKVVKNNVEDTNKAIKTTTISFKGIGTSLKDIIGKVGKWTLAVFGLRSAYSFIRSIVSNIASSDDGISKKIEYVKWVIASVIKPAVEWIVNLILKGLDLIAKFLKPLLGYNLLDKFSFKEFEKAKKNTKEIKNNVKETKKALYGWDELTRIDDTKGGIAGLGSALSSSLSGSDKTNITDDIKTTIGDGVAKGFDAGITAFKVGGTKVLVDVVSTAFENGTGGGIAKGIDAGVTALKTGGGVALTQAVTTAFESGTGGKIKTGIEAIGATIKGVFSDTNTGIENTTSKATAKIGGISKTIKEDITGSVKGLGDKLKEINDKKYKVNIDTAKPKNAKDYTSTTLSKLKDLASKTWKIATKFTSSGASKDTQNSWLEPIRKVLKKIGIEVPKLAKGGIINLPSKGIPVGSAIAGERGQEGVIPLTDSQQMAMLGEAIGKYITINASITNTMNGRVISRELQKIQQESNFANNR